MIKAEIRKAKVVQSGNCLYLLGSAEYKDDAINFKVPFDLDDFDPKAFFKALREKIAEDFDVAEKRVELNEKHLLQKMITGQIVAAHNAVIQ